MTVFAVNRGTAEPLPLEISLRGTGVSEIVEHSTLHDADPDARNTLTEPERVAPRTQLDAELSGGTLRTTLAPLSWNMIRLV